MSNENETQVLENIPARLFHLHKDAQKAFLKDKSNSYSSSHWHSKITADVAVKFSRWTRETATANVMMNAGKTMEELFSHFIRHEY